MLVGKTENLETFFKKCSFDAASHGHRFALHQGSVPNNFLISVLVSFTKKPAELVLWKTELVFSLK